MNTIEKLCKITDPLYDKQIKLILDNIVATKLQNEINSKEKAKANDGYMFINTSGPQSSQNNYNKNSQYNNSQYNNPYKKTFIKANQYTKYTKNTKDDDYPFI